MKPYTQEEITLWAHREFGKPPNLNPVMDRLYEEVQDLRELVQVHPDTGPHSFKEDFNNWEKLRDQLAVVEILVRQLAQNGGVLLEGAVHNQMDKNLSLEWERYGDGTGRPK